MGLSRHSPRWDWGDTVHHGTGLRPQEWDWIHHVYKDAHYPEIGSLVFAINLVYNLVYYFAISTQAVTT